MYEGPVENGMYEGVGKLYTTKGASKEPVVTETLYKKGRMNMERVVWNN